VKLLWSRNFSIFVRFRLFLQIQNPEDFKILDLCRMSGLVRNSFWPFLAVVHFHLLDLVLPLLVFIFLLLGFCSCPLAGRAYGVPATHSALIRRTCKHCAIVPRFCAWLRSQAADTSSPPVSRIYVTTTLLRTIPLPDAVTASYVPTRTAAAEDTIISHLIFNFSIA